MAIDIHIVDDVLDIGNQTRVGGGIAALAQILQQKLQSGYAADDSHRIVLDVVGKVADVVKRGDLLSLLSQVHLLDAHCRHAADNIEHQQVFGYKIAGAFVDQLNNPDNLAAG